MEDQKTSIVYNSINFEQVEDNIKIDQNYLHTQPSDKDDSPNFKNLNNIFELKKSIESNQVLTSLDKIMEDQNQNQESNVQADVAQSKVNESADQNNQEQDNNITKLGAQDFSFSSSEDEKSEKKQRDKARKKKSYVQNNNNDFMNEQENDQKDDVSRSRSPRNLGKNQYRDKRSRSRSNGQRNQDNGHYNQNERSRYNNEFQERNQKGDQVSDDKHEDGDFHYYKGRDNRRDKDRRDKPGRSSQKIRFPSFNKPMFTKKDFENYQDVKFDKFEIQDAYNDYVVQYKKEQDYEFYKRHRNDPWFIERYDPTEIYKQKQTFKKTCNYEALRFKQTVIEKLLDKKDEYYKLRLEQVNGYDYNLQQDDKGKEIQLHKAPHFSFDTDFLTLYLKYIPVEIRRSELTDSLEKNTQGFIHLSLSEPMRNHNFSRLAWATYQTMHDCQQALEKLPSIYIDNFQIQAMQSHPIRKRTAVRISPPLPAIQNQIDLEMCKILIEKVFDPEKDIQSFIVSAVQNFKFINETQEFYYQDDQSQQNQENEQKQDCSELINFKLDLLILYLRRVHAYCLYCGEEYEDERMLSTRCGPQHIRNHQKIPEQEFQEIIENSKKAKENAEFSLEQQINEKFQNSNLNENQKASVLQLIDISELKSSVSQNWGGSIHFLTKYVSAALKKIQDGPVKIIDPQQEFINQDLEKFCKSQVKEIEKGVKYQCKICEKNFKGESFVINHIKNKHNDVIDEAYERQSTKEWLENTIQKQMKKEMKQNYNADPNKLFNQPGRKYHFSESSYAFNQTNKQGLDQGGNENYQGRYDQNKGGRLNNNRGFGNRGGMNNNKFGRGGYVDYDDPEVNANLQKQKKEQRELVDYSDLFG